MSNTEKYDFERQLIKGRITETIFDQMFREREDFIVIPFGYEKVLPEITQYAEGREAEMVKDNIRNAPDYALISHKHNGIYLVEVKYRRKINNEEVLEIAEKIHKRWKLVWLFMATQEGFYFDSCANILRKKKIIQLSTSWISKDVQDSYHKMIRSFIQNGNQIKN